MDALTAIAIFVVHEIAAVTLTVIVALGIIAIIGGVVTLIQKVFGG